MKFKIFFLVASFFITASISQADCQTQQTEGTVRYLQISDWTKMMNSLDYISQAQKDRVTLMSAGRGEWKQYKNLHFSLSRSKYENSEEEAQTHSQGRRWRQDEFIIHNDHESNEMTIIQTLLDRAYIIKDSVQHPVWKIKNDLKQIAGHMCMNATYYDSIRAYDVVAWFALNIPVSTGPDRFAGLPGLILEVDIGNGALVLSADRIEFKELDEELELPAKTRGRQINYTEYNELISKNIEDQKKAERPWFFAIPY